MQTAQSLEGILLIDKPTGITAHDVVDCVRRKLAMKQIGHAGTLDPMATGLMILLIGKATKVSQYLICLNKEYTGTIKFGETTNTQDTEGTIQATQAVPDLTSAQLQAYMQQFLGDQYQIPPMFSAKKLNGVPLYKHARKGRDLERPPCFIHIAQFTLQQWNSPFVHFHLLCSKGTYVRTIAHDLGQKIGCGAHLTSLRRTSSEQFSIEKAVTLEAFENLSMKEIGELLVPVYEAVRGRV